MAELRNRATLDIADFRRGVSLMLSDVDRVQKRINLFSGSALTLAVNVNTTQATAKLAALQAAMNALSNATVNVGTRGGLPTAPAVPSPIPANGAAQANSFNSSLTVVSSTVRSYTTVLGLVSPQLSGVSYWTLRLIDELGLFAGASNAAKLGLLGMVAVAGTLLTAVMALGKEGFNETKKLSDSFAILEANGVSALTRVEEKIKGIQGLSFTLSRKSVTDYAEGLATLQRAGQTGADGLNILKNATILAANEGQNLNETSIQLTRNILQFGDDASQAGRYADVLTKASNDAIGSASDLSKGLNTVGTIAKFAGFSLEETTAALVELDNKGLSAADKGATALRTVLAATTSPTQQFRTAAKGLGVDLEDASGKIRSARDVVFDLIDALHKNNVTYDEATGKVTANADAVAAASTLFKTRGFAAILSLTDQTLKLADSYKNASGAAEDYANILAKTPTGALERLNAAGKDLALSFGKIITPALIAGATGLTGLFRSLEGVFNTIGDNKVLLFTLSTLGAGFVALKLSAGLSAASIVLFNNAIRLNVLGSVAAQGPLLAMSFGARTVAGSFALATLATQGLATGFKTLTAALVANPITAIFVGLAVVAGVAANAVTRFYEDSTKASEASIAKSQEFVEKLKKVRAEASKLNSPEYTALKSREFIQQDNFNTLFNDPNANIKEFAAAGNALKETRSQISAFQKQLTQNQRESIGLTDEQSAAFDALNEKILTLQTNFRSSGATDFEKDLQRVRKEIDDLVKSVNKDFGGNKGVLDSKLQQLQQLEQDLLSQSINKAVQTQADSRLEIEKSLAQARIALLKDGQQKANATLELELTDIKKNYAKRIDEAQKNLAAAKRDGNATPAQIGDLETGLFALRRLQGDEQRAARAKRNAEIVKLEQDVQDKIYGIEKTGADRRANLEAGGLDRIKDTVTKREEQRRIDLANANRTYDDLERTARENLKKTTDPRLVAEYNKELERLAIDRTTALKGIEGKAGDELISLRKAQIDQLLALQQTLAQSQLSNTQAGVSALEGNRDRALSGATTPQERAQIEAQSQARILELQQNAAQQSLKIAQDTAQTNLSKALENARTLGASEGAARKTALETYQNALQTAETGFNTTRQNNTFASEKRIKDIRLEGLKAYLQGETESLNALTGLELETSRKRLEAKLLVYRATGDREAVKAIEDALRGVNRQVNENSRTANKSLTDTKTTVLDLRAALEDAFGKSSPLEKAQDNAQKPFESVAKGAKDAARALSEQLGKVNPSSALAGQLKAQIVALNQVQLEAQKGGFAARASAELDFNTAELGKAREFALKRAKTLYDSSPEVYVAGYQKELAAQQTFLETRLKDLKAGSAEYEQVQAALETNRDTQKGLIDKQRQNAADLAGYKREELEASLALTTSDSQRQGVLAALTRSSAEAVKSAQANVTALEAQKAPQAEILKAKRDLATVSVKQLEDEKKLYQDAPGVTQAREQLDLKLKLAKSDAERATTQAQILSSDETALERAKSRVFQAQAEGKPQEFVNGLIKERSALLERVKGEQDSILEGVNRQADAELTLFKARQGLQATKARSDAEVLQAQQDGIGYTLKEIANVDRLIAQGKAQGATEADLKGLIAQRLGLEGTLYGQVNTARRAGLGIEGEKLSLLEAQSKTMLELSGLADDAVAVSQVDLRIAQAKLELAQKRLAEEQKSGTDSSVRTASENVLSAQTEASAKERAASAARFTATQELLDAQGKLNAARLEEAGLSDNVLEKAKSQLQSDYERKAVLESQLSSGKLSIEGQRKAQDELNQLSGKIAGDERATGAASLTLIDEKLARESRIAGAKLAQLGLDDTALANAKLQVAAQETLVAALENKLQLGTLTPREQADTTAALEEARAKLAGDRKTVTAEELVISGKVNTELEKRLGFQERLLNAGLKALGVDGNALVQAQAAVSLTDEKIKLLEKELAGQLSAQDRTEKTVQLEELRNLKTAEGRTLAHARYGEEERLLGVQEAQIAAQLEQAGLDANGITAARVRLGIEQTRLARMQAELASGTGTPAEQDALRLSIDKQRGVVAAGTRAVSAAETSEVDKRLSLEERLFAAKVKQKGLSDNDLAVLQAGVVLEQRKTAELEKRLKDPKLNPDQKRELSTVLEEQKGKQAEKEKAVADRTRAIEEEANVRAEKNLGLLERQFQAKLKLLSTGQSERIALEGTIALEQRRLNGLQNRLSTAPVKERGEIETGILESQAKIAEGKRGLDKLAQADLERRLSLEDRVTAARILQAGLSSNDAAAQRIGLAQEDARTKRIEDRVKNPALTSTEKDELRVQLEESRGKAVERRLALRATENADLERQLSLSERLVAAEVQRSGQDSPLTSATAQVLTTQRAVTQLQAELNKGGLSSTDQAEKRVKLSELSAKLAGDERGQRVALYGEAQRILETEKSTYELKLKQAGLDGNAIQSAQLERDYNKAALGLNAKQLLETNLTETERNKLLAERNVLLGQSVDAERKVFGERFKQVALNLQGDKNRAEALLKLNFVGDDVAGAGLGLKSAQATLEVAKQQLAEGQKLKLNREEIKALVDAERTATEGVTLAQREVNKALEARELLQRGLNDSLDSLRRASGIQNTGLQGALEGLTLASNNVGRAAQDAAPYLEKVARGEELTAEEALKARGPIDALTSSLGAKRQALEAASKAYRDQVSAITGLQDAVATLNDILKPQDGAGFARADQRANEALAALEDALKSNDPEKIAKATSEFNSAYSSYKGLLDQNRAAKAEVEKAQADLITARAGTDLKATEEATKRLAEAQKKFADLGGDTVQQNTTLESGAQTSLDALKAKLPALELQKERLKGEADRLEKQARAQQLEVSRNSLKVVDSLKLVLDKLSSEGLFKDLFKGVPEQAEGTGFVAGLAFGAAFEKGNKIQRDLAGATAAADAIVAFLSAGTKGNEAGLYFADEFKAGTANIGSDIVNSLASSLPLGDVGAKAAGDLLGGFDARMNEATDSKATDKFVQNVTAKLSSIPAQAAQSASDASAAVAKNLANLENLKLKFPTLFATLPDEAAKKGAEAGDLMGKALKASLEASLRNLNLGGLLASIKTQANAAVKSAADSVAAREVNVPASPPTPAGQNISRSTTYADTYNLTLTLQNPPNAPIDADVLARQIEPRLRDLRQSRLRNTGECE